MMHPVDTPADWRGGTCCSQNEVLKMVDKKTFDKKVVWITGASSGIGEALALKLSKMGARLIISSNEMDSCCLKSLDLWPSKIHLPDWRKSQIQPLCYCFEFVICNSQITLSIDHLGSKRITNKDPINNIVLTKPGNIFGFLPNHFMIFEKLRTFQ